MIVRSLLFLSIVFLSQGSFAKDMNFEAAHSFVPQTASSSKPADVMQAAQVTAQRFEAAKIWVTDFMNVFCGKENVKKIEISQHAFPDAATGPDTVEVVAKAVCDSNLDMSGFFVKSVSN